MPLALVALPLAKASEAVVGSPGTTAAEEVAGAVGSPGSAEATAAARLEALSAATPITAQISQVGLIDLSRINNWKWVNYQNSFTNGKKLRRQNM